jgi:hypothetical protein
MSINMSAGASVVQHNCYLFAQPLAASGPERLAILDLIWDVTKDMDVYSSGRYVADIGGTLVTIEGNTDDGGHRDGIGVFQRSRRKIRDINMGFVAFS